MYNVFTRRALPYVHVRQQNSTVLSGDFLSIPPQIQICIPVLLFKYSRACDLPGVTAGRVSLIMQGFLKKGPNWKWITCLYAHRTRGGENVSITSSPLQLPRPPQNLSNPTF